MKTITTLLFLLISFITTYAQPVITSANYPLAGESFSGFLDLPSWNPGPSGANQTWDFSTLGGTTSTVSYENPSSTTYGASFPGSNVALSQFLSYLYYNTSPTQLEVTGTLSSFTFPANPRPFTNYQTIITFPFTYEDELKDTATTGVILRPDNPPGTPTGTQKRVVYSETIADGYGTLLLPNSTTFSNVLRVRVTTETIDTSWNTSNVPTESITIDTQYYFISEDHKPHVLLLAKFVTNSSETIGAQYITSPSLPTSVKKSQNAYVKIFPNPASSNIKIELSENINSSKDKLSFQLFNSTGIAVSTDQPFNSIDGVYSLSGLEKGFYFYQLKEEGQVIDSGKLVIE